MRFVIVAFVLALAAGVTACAGDGAAPTTTATTPETEEPTPATGPDPSQACGRLLPGRSAATVTEQELAEISGLAASRRHPGALWAHNDSGGGAVLYALGSDGALLARYEIAGVPARDWEDIAVGPGPTGDVIYVADTGDNSAARASVSLVVVPEPSPTQAEDTLGGAVSFELVYPDGAHDAETLLVDPIGGEILVVTKELSGRSSVYRVPQPPAAGSVLEPVGEIDFGLGGLATGGDVSADGTRVVIRTYADAFVWDRDPAETLPEALARQPCAVGLVPEPQGEAVAFVDGGLMTVTEGSSPTLYAYDLTE